MLNIEIILTKIYMGITFVYVALYIEEKILNKEKSIKIVRNRFGKILMILGTALIILEIINKNLKISVITILVLVTLAKERKNKKEISK